MVAVQIDLVGSNDAYLSFVSSFIGKANGSAKENSRGLLARPGSFWIYHFRGFDSLGEKANARIDLPQTPFAVLIVGVFAAIAIAGSPCNDLRHGRAFPGEQKAVFIFEALQPCGCYVIFYMRCRLVRSWVSGEPFPH